MTYRALDPAAITATCERLVARIHERFPGSGLHGVATELLAVARESADRIDAIRRPNVLVRAGVVVALLLTAISAVALVLLLLERTADPGLFSLLQGIESAVNDAVFLGIAVFFLLTIEARLKRRKALRALHQLRSIAHVIDMHQLTKDPERVDSPGDATASSPRRTLSRFELARYLDYCSEMLAIVSKIAALYVQRFDDALVLGAINDIQGLTTGLSSKIWQKIVILSAGDARDGTR